MNAFQTKGLIKAICFLSIFYVHCYGQQKKSFDKYFTAGYNFGFLGYAPSKAGNVDGQAFSRSGAVFFSEDGRGSHTLPGVSTFGLHAGFLWQYKHSKNMTAINFFVQQNRNAYVFALPYKKKVPTRSGDGDADDPPTGDSTNVSTGNWTETLNYLYYGVSVQQLFYADDISLFLGGDKYRYIKLSYGQTGFYRSRGSNIVTGNTDSGYDEKNNRTSGTTTVINPNNNMLGVEVGTRSFSKTKDRSLDIGLSCSIPIGPPAYTREYNFYERKPSAKLGAPATMQPIGHENIPFSQASILLNISYNFNSHVTPRQRDTTLYSFPKIEKTPPQPVVRVHKPHELNGRKVKVLEKINVNDTIISAEVWDKGKIDGDRISLYLNGVDILDDYTVGKTKKEIVLHLVPGKNYLVMHALNLGRIPPNTAALELSDGGKPNLIILNSDLKKSGAIEIDYNPI